MRRLAPLCLLLACAHGDRSRDAANWLELSSEHFVVRTDLPPEDAQKAVRDLERVRAALMIAAWHVARPSARKVAVVDFADDSELEQIVKPGVLGFVGEDWFDQPMMMISASRRADDLELLKHELAHVITNEFLLTRPWWVAEGLACYLETLRIDHGYVRVGHLNEQRLIFLKQHQVDVAWPLHEARSAVEMTLRVGYAFETGSWLLVHWLVDTRPRQFDGFLARLGRQGWKQAWQEEFPDLTDDAVRAGVVDYLTRGEARIAGRPAPGWEGSVAARRMDPAEVHALRADLLRMTSVAGQAEGRKALIDAEVARALALDPANPLALAIAGADPAPAVKAHPDDWRSWLSFARHNGDDLASLARAADLAADNADVLARLAVAEADAGRQREALDDAIDAAHMAPSDRAVLHVLARLYAAAGRCAEAVETERRALESLPDSAPPEVVAMLSERLEEIPRMCDASGAPDRQAPQVQPELKACRVPTPSTTHFKGTVVVRLTVQPDGSVTDVVVRGGAGEALTAAIREHFESCKYRPGLSDGQPTAVRAGARLVYGEAR